MIDNSRHPVEAVKELDRVIDSLGHLIDSAANAAKYEGGALKDRECRRILTDPPKALTRADALIEAAKWCIHFGLQGIADPESGRPNADHRRLYNEIEFLHGETKELSDRVNRGRMKLNQ